MAENTTEPVDVMKDPVFTDAPENAELQYMSKEEFFNNKVQIIDRKIASFFKFKTACEAKIVGFVGQYGQMDLSAVPAKDLFEWGDLEIRVFDIEATLNALLHEKDQVVKNLKQYLHYLSILRKEVEEGNWEKAQNALKEAIRKKTQNRHPHHEESNSLARSYEPFADEADKLEHYRVMKVILGWVKG